MLSWNNMCRVATEWALKWLWSVFLMLFFLSMCTVTFSFIYGIHSSYGMYVKIWSISVNIAHINGLPMSKRFVKIINSFFLVMSHNRKCLKTGINQLSIENSQDQLDIGIFSIYFVIYAIKNKENGSGK